LGNMVQRLRHSVRLCLFGRSDRNEGKPTTISISI
jgi:hypothetical protein